MTTAVRLLQQIDGLPFPERQQRLADTARRLAGTAELDGLLAGLAAEGSFGARTALRMATIAGHGAHVEQCLDSPVDAVRTRALVAAVRLGLPTSLLVERLPRMPAAHRATLYRALRRVRRTELAEALLPVARQHFGDPEAAGLLPAVGHERAADLLPELDHAVASWSALARRHPAQLLAHVEARLSAEPTASWTTTWSQVGQGVAAATWTDPARVLDLLERSLPYAPFPTALGREAGRLARCDASRFVRLLTDPRRQGHLHIGRKVMKACVGLPDDELADLGRVLDGTGRLASLLHALPPARRAHVHRAVVGSGDPGTGGLVEALAAIDELPVPARQEEARRLLTFRAVAEHPRARHEVTARLDWPSARAALSVATREPETDVRAHAYGCLVVAATGSRDHAVLAEMLGSLQRVRNDQDVVRGSVITALAVAPPWLFEDTDAAVVSRLLTDAVEARDTSWTTSSAVRSLSDRLLREGVAREKPLLTQAGIEGLQLLASHGAGIDLHGIDRDLPHGAEEPVLEALLPRLESDAARGEYDVALALARGLGRRAWDLPRLQSFVDRARSAKADHVVREAISLWLAPPATRDARVASTLRADRSTITFTAVADAVGWRRTDLLDDVFRRSMHGRFLPRRVRFVPHFDRCVDRWLPRQVAAYARLLEGVASSSGLPVWERASATRLLGPLAGSERVVEALTHDAEVAVAETAIAALAWSEHPVLHLPALRAFAQTDRARVAVPAITRVARFVPPDDLVEALRPLLAGEKITSRKEGARLLAEHRVPGAVALLRDAWEAPDQHRDVRRAVAAAARFQLDEEDAWLLLARAADHPETATAVLDLRAMSVARTHRAAFAALVQKVAESDDPDVARRGLECLPEWLPWRPGAVDLLAEVVTDLDRSAVWTAALTALVRGCVVTGSAVPLVATAQSLDAADDESRDGPDRDRPARRRLADLVHQLHQETIGGHHRDLAAELGESLAATRPDLAIRLLAVGVDLTDDLVDDRVLERICGLATRTSLVGVAHRAVRHQVQRVAHRAPGRADDLLGRLPVDDAAHACVALAVARAAGDVHGWSASLQAHVRRLREHPDPDVRDAALDVPLAHE